MKTHLNILFFTILSLMLGVLPISAQIVDEQGQYVDTTFHDNVDRTAEDFVIASLLIADPVQGILSPAGHTALRLRCPAFDMDYVFHYAMIFPEEDISETEAVLSGQFRAQLVADSFHHYLAYCNGIQRGLTEYPLNLLNSEEQRLWQLLDEELVGQKPLRYDFITKGCCARTIIIIIRALKDKNIDYSQCDPRFGLPPYELLSLGMEHVPWQRFFLLSAIYGAPHSTKPGDNIFLPADLARAWQSATVRGEPLLGDGVRLLPNSYYRNDSWFTPWRFALIVLLLSIASLFVRKPYINYALLAVHAIIIFALTVMAILAAPFVQWNWLIIPFNPLPLICWKWRRYWALPYVSVLVVWCLVMLFVPHMLVDATHIILTLALAIVLFKQSNILQRWVQSRVDKSITDKIFRVTKKK